MSLQPDYSQTTKMLAMLAHDNKGITFQTFNDNADQQNKSLIKQFHGSHDLLASQLTQLNSQGAGIFVAVNKTDGKGRKQSNITAVRGLFVDFDTQDNNRLDRLISLELPPSLIIESSPSKHHAYWLADGIPLNKFKQWQKLLIAFFAGMNDIPDQAIHDLPRVMRLAGYYHQKVKAKDGLTGKPFMTRVIYEGKRYELAELEAWLNKIAGKPALPVVEPAKQSKRCTDKQTDINSLTYTKLNDQLPQLTADKVRALSRGRWGTILNRLGYTVSSDPQEHTPCPVCGGTDRFRFDDEHGKGTYICSQGTGETKGSDGLSLLIDHAGMTVTDALTAVTSVLNEMGLISDSDSNPVPSLSDWPQPEPLATDPSKPTPYPIEAWQGLLRSVVEKIAYYAQVPHAMAGQCVLGALAHMGQRFIDAPMGHKHIPASLYLVTEGESGSGKSVAMGLSHYKIKAYEREQYQIYLEQLSEWEAEKDTLQGKERKEFLANHPRPFNPITMFGDATIEPILDKFLNGEMINASWSTDEAGQFFNGYTMKGDTAGNALSALTTLYSDGEVNRLRSQKSQHANPRSQAYDVRMTLLLMGQRVVLEDALTDPMMNGQGFLARAMIACPDSLQGQRVWNDPKRRQQSPYDDTDLIAYWEKCRTLLDPAPINDPSINANLNGRVKICWHDAQAEQAFYDGMQAIENRQAKGHALEYLKAYASRMAENASRIASLMAFFEGRYTITVDDIKRAFMLVEYSTSERLRYLDASPTGEQNNSEKLSDWLASKAKDKQPHKLNYSYIYNGAPVPLRKDTKRLKNELSILESAGHIKQELEGKRQVIYINPYLYS